MGRVVLLAECSGPCTVCVVTAVNDLHSVFLFLKQVFHSPYCRQNAAIASSCSPGQDGRMVTRVPRSSGRGGDGGG